MLNKTEHAILMEEVLNEDEVVGYNIFDDTTNEAIGYIFLEGEEGNWVCDKDTDTKFPNDQFEQALIHCIYMDKEGK